MPAAALVAIADVVVEDLQAGQSLDADGVNTGVSGNPPRISQPLDVSYVYSPRFHAADHPVGSWQVLVATAGEETERLDRNTLQATYHIEIGICGRVAAGNEAALNAAMQLLQELGDFFFDFGLSNDAAVWVRNQVYAWPDREMLQANGVVFALWDAVFIGTRKKAGT